MDKVPKSKVSDLHTAFLKASAYCAYQERTQQEVRDKLYEWGLWTDAVEETIARLVSENFINEERFARAFAGGKFRIKKWGRIKILLALKQKKISTYCIRKAMEEINDHDYLATLRALIVKKTKEIPGKKTAEKNYRVANYVMSKGFEPELVWDVIRAFDENHPSG